MNTNTIAPPDLGKLNELAKVHALSYASPHHFTMSVNGLREVVSALQPPAGNTIALDALKAAYSAMQHMGNVLNNIDAVDEDEDAQHDAAFEAVRAAIAELEHPKKLRVVAAPMNSYPEADQRFFDFWYGHMVEDFMQPPLVDIDHATARYIWNAAEQARAAIAALEAEPQPEQSWTREQLQAAFDAEIAYVSSVPYSSSEICRWFYENLLRRLPVTPPKD